MSEMSPVDAGAAWSYRPGPWFGVFGPEVTVLLPEAQRDQMLGLWSLVDGGGGFDEVLDALLASGLSRIPAFVLVGTTAGGSTHILLRGEGVHAGLSTAAEEVAIDGTAGTTWAERTVEGVTALRITLPDAPDTSDIAGGAAAGFPIQVGLVRVGGVDRPPAGAAPAAEPAPVEEPAMVEEPAVVEEPAPLEEPAMVEEPAMAAMVDEGPPTELMPSITGDPLTDPLPPHGETPAGWVTPWDSPPPPSAPAAEEPAEPDPGPEPEPTPEPEPEPPPAPEPEPVGWPAPGGAEPMTEVAPSFPPPPPASAPPPLGIGSWEPVGGFPPPPPAPSTDHDGLTRTSAEQPAPPAPPGIPGQPPAPAITKPVAKLLISDGQSIVVDRVVLIGRAPEARRFTSTEQPLLVTVPSRLHEISSTHVEVRPGTGADHGSAVVTDMGSTNGTVLVQPGLGPEDLKPGIAVQLIPGAIINLGDGITIQVTRP